MGIFRLIMYGLATLSLAGLALPIWRRDRKGTVDQLISSGITVCLVLTLFPPLFLRGAGWFLVSLTFVLLAADMVRKAISGRKSPASGAEPPAV